MHNTVTDSEKRCADTIRTLQGNLLEMARELQQSGDLQAALITSFRAYALRPGVSPVLQSIAQIYEALNDPESAQLCRRGVVPESAEAALFNAKTSEARLIPAKGASDNKHYKVYSPEKIELPAPVSNADSRKRPEFRARHTESRGSFVSVLNNGALWFDGFNTLITDSRNHILKEHIRGSTALVADVSRQRAERKFSGTVCFLDARSSSIYYHWMVDVLPKIALIRKAGIALESIDHFVVSCESEFQRQSLLHLGIDLRQIHAPVDSQAIRADTLIVPFLKHDRGDRIYNGLGLGMARWVPAWLSETFNSEATEHSPAKVYLSRAQRGTRAPTNEAQLVSALEQRGFTSVTLEDLSIVQQAKLLASASVVVAPHGAGLTNIAFCKPGTMVVEIFGELVVPCYWALSALAELDYYHYLTVEASTRQLTARSAVTPSADENNHKATSDTGVNLSALAARRNLGIDLDVDEFIKTLDGWMLQAAAA